MEEFILSSDKFDFACVKRSEHFSLFNLFIDLKFAFSNLFALPFRNEGQPKLAHALVELFLA